MTNREKTIKGKSTAATYNSTQQKQCRKRDDHKKEVNKLEKRHTQRERTVALLRVSEKVTKHAEKKR